MIRKLIGIEIIFHAKSVGALILRFWEGERDSIVFFLF